MSKGPVDSHAHLSQSDFDKDRKEVIERAREAGIKKILSIGTEREEFEQELAIAKGHPDLIFTGLGYHPHIAKDIKDEHYDALQALIEENRQVIALGEIGLDFYYNHSDPGSQEGVFREQLRLAGKIPVPVIIHCRQAYPEMIRILKTEPVNPEQVLIHCFSGDPAQAEALLKWGAMLSFAGPVTYPKADRLREAVMSTPLDRLLAETDCPYLAPRTNRGKRNEPSYVIETYKEIASVKGISYEALVERVYINFCSFFDFEVA